ncbi:MAG: glycosyltransferase family 2 protein [Atribacterota bacterium]|nr:glycosyltransferase family 2 protein [Atribacterota bacterium]
MKYELSIIIPARNEIFIGKTVENLLQNLTGSTEIIIVLDGYTVPIPDIPCDSKVTLIGHTTSVGQRAACNEGARLSQSKYLMKMDAHCSIDKGMDSVMLADMKDDWTFVPLMRNLWAFDWVCKKCGDRRYQGPTPTSCPKCDNTTEFEKDMKWIGKSSPQSTTYCFDSEPHFQYFNEFKKRPEGKGDITETMSLQGSSFMLTKEKWFELNICDEGWGSWGSQGIEVAVKTWLSGGKVMVNHKTWYAHMFRTQGGDFSFPFPISGNQVSYAKKTAREIFYNYKWEKQKYPLSWLVKKFWPVKGWTDKDLKELQEKEGKKISKPTKGIVYYTNNGLDNKIMKYCQDQILDSINGSKIVSISQKPIDFGNNIVMDLDHSPKSMFTQILKGLEEIDTDIVFLCEHDIIYNKTHFDFTPPKEDEFYYNTNVWFLRMSDGHCLYYACAQLSGLCGYRKALLTHFKERMEMINEIGFSRHIGFEPMTHGRIKWKNWYRFVKWESEKPNIDIKHGKNQLKARWSKEEFRRVPDVWVESDEIPKWGKGKDIVKALK